MKKIEAIIQPTKLEAIKEALALVGVSRITVNDVHGFGRERDSTELFAGYSYEVSFMRRLKIEIVVNDDFLDTAIETIVGSARTGSEGKLGDGKIFVLPIDECIRIRTGESGGNAV